MGGAAFRTPRLPAEAAGAVAVRVTEAAARGRAERRLAEVIATLGATGARFGREGDPVRDEAVALLCEELAWPGGLAAETLSRMAAVWTEDALWAPVRRELPDPGVLDGYAADRAARESRRPATSGRRHRAAGPPLLLTVHAGNVPGVAVSAAIRTLVVRSGSLNRVSRDEPGLLALFARALREADPLLADGVASTWWPAPTPESPVHPWVKESGKVVVYGGEETVLAVRRTLPAETDLVTYGPKIGVGVVLPDAARDAGELGAWSRALAWDTLAYQGRGCVTPRSIFVCAREREGEEETPAAVACRVCEALAAALRAESARLPRPGCGDEEAVAIRALRARVEFGALAGGGEADGGACARRWWGDETNLAWTVALGPASAYDPESLPGLLTVTPVADLARIESLLAPLRGRIQAIGHAGREELERLAEVAVRLGASRLAPFGSVAWPPADWHHDGRGQLLPLLEWTDWDPPSPPEASGTSPAPDDAARAARRTT